MAEVLETVVMLVWLSSQLTGLKNFLSCLAFGTCGLEMTRYKQRQNSRFGTSTGTFINKIISLKGCGRCCVVLESNIQHIGVFFLFFLFFLFFFFFC